MPPCTFETLTLSNAEHSEPKQKEPQVAIKPKSNQRLVYRDLKMTSIGDSVEEESKEPGTSGSTRAYTKAARLF